MSFGSEARVAALRGQKTLRADTADMLHRLVRDPRRAVWADACYLAGRKAVRDSSAWLMIEELLDGPLREMRLRGVVALASLAEGRPESAVAFFEQALEDEQFASDPVLLDALLEIPAHLPLELGAPLMARAGRDSRPAVRAAAAGAMRDASAPHSPGLLVELAMDPSPVVRSSLAWAVCGRLEEYEAIQAAGFLADDPLPMVRAYLARELPRTELALPLLTRLAQDAEASVRDAVHEPEAARQRPFTPRPEGAAAYPGIAPLEQQLDRHPEDTFDILRPLLEADEGLQILESLAQLSRNADIGALCRALRLLIEPGHLGPEERMVGVFERLGQPRHPAVAAFRAFVAYALDALRVGRPSGAVAWGRQVQAETAYVQASVWLEGLGRLCALAEAMDAHIGDLPQALAWLEQSTDALRADFSPPERIILLLVAERWGDMLDQEIQDQVAGVTS